MIASAQMVRVVLLAVLAAAPAFGQAYATDFETGTSGWSFQFTTPSARWTIDGTPAVFVSPTQTLNNADSLTGLMESGSGDAFSPSALLSGSSDKSIQFRCRYAVVADQDTWVRKMKIGSGLPGGVTHAEILFNDLSSLFDDVNVVPGQFIVDCPSTDWHLHTIEAKAGDPNLVIDGSPRGGSTAARDALFGTTSVNSVFSYEWNEIVVPPALTVYGIVVWLIDDFSIGNGLTDAFAPAPEPVAGTSGGGGGGGSSGCVASPAIRGGTGWIAAGAGASFAAATFSLRNPRRLSNNEVGRSFRG